LKELTALIRRKSLETQIIKVKSHTGEFTYKCSIDNLMFKLPEKSKWPYELAFDFAAGQEGIEVSAKKNIVLVPDNKSDY
jgi:hypothetical protein